jgi:hypothetical protein
LREHRQQPASTGDALAEFFQRRFFQPRAANECGPRSGEPRCRNRHLAGAMLRPRGRVPDDDLNRAGVEHVERADADGWLAGPFQQAQRAQDSVYFRLCA